MSVKKLKRILIPQGQKCGGSVFVFFIYFAHLLKIIFKNVEFIVKYVMQNAYIKI